MPRRRKQILHGCFRRTRRILRMPMQEIWEPGTDASIVFAGCGIGYTLASRANGLAALLRLPSLAYVYSEEDIHDAVPNDDRKIAAQEVVPEAHADAIRSAE